MYDYYPARLLTLATPPAIEPVSLADAKLYLRVDASAEDSLISSLITAARQAAERHTRRSFITQTWKLAFDDYAPEETPLPHGPVQSVSSVKSITRGGTETLISNSSYILNASKDRVVFDARVYGFSVEILYVTGYGAAASSVPSALVLGMISHIAAWYEQRGEGGDIPPAALALYQPYREVLL